VVRFLHTSDWQLGMGRAYLDPDALPRFRQARVDAIRTLGRLAAEHDVAFVVVAGDVFETNQVDRATVVRTCEALGEVPVPVFLLPGNHDPLDGASVFTSTAFTNAAPGNVTVLDDEQPRPVEGVAAEVVGAPWRSKRPLSDLAAAALPDEPPPAGHVRVLVAHGATDAGVAPDRDDPAVVRAAPLLDAVDQGRLHYVALGDRHSTLDAGDHGQLWYSGAPEPTAFDEVDAGNALLVDLEPDRSPRVTKLRTGRWRFLRIEGELRDVASVERLAARLDEIDDRTTAVVRLVLRGVVSLQANADLQRLLDERRPAFAALDVPDRHDHLVIEPDDADLDALDLRGYAAAALEDLRGRAADEAVAGEALAELFRLVDHGRSGAGAR